MAFSTNFQSSAMEEVFLLAWFPVERYSALAPRQGASIAKVKRRTTYLGIWDWNMMK